MTAYCALFPTAALRRAMLLASAAALAGAGAAHAQAAADEPANLGEIVVTAQKRAERLQDVPVSVNVVSSEAIKDAHITGLQQLQQISPSLSFTPSANTRGQGLSIRGIGTLNFSDGVEPSVSVVVDGVVIGRSAASFFDFNDIARIEVLRGPQGMLFGKNSAAGVINIVTARPSLTQASADASASYATFNEVRLKASASTPLVEDKLAGNVSAFYNHSDGFITNLYDGKKYNGLNSYGMRGKLAWKPDETTDVFVALDYTRNDQDCCVGTVNTILPTTRYLGPAGPTRASLFSGVELGRYSRQAKFDGAFFNDQKTWGASVEANKDLQVATLTSITAYREFRVSDNNDADGTSLPLVNINSADQKQIQFSEEFRIASPAGQTLEYVAGLFYFDQDVKTVTALKGNFGNVLPPAAFFQNTIDRGIKTRNWAAFGQATWHVTDDLRLIGGLRYTHERLRARFLRTIDPTAAGPMPGLGGPFLIAPDITASDSDVSYKLGAQYNFNRATMVYATYSKGYKGQAINLLNNLAALSISSGAAVLKPEIVRNYEVGLRSSPFDGATVNLTVFNTEFRNFQASTFDPVTTSFTLLNAGKLRSRGAELEAQYSPVRALRLGANLAYADTKVWKFFPACYPGQTLALGCAGASQDVSGAGLANAPLWSLTLSADYRHELQNTPFDLTAGANYSYRSSVFFVYRDPNAVQPGYGLANLNLGLQTRDGRYQLTGFVRNVFDKHFVSAVGTGFRDSSASGAGYTQTLTTDAFRRVGVELRAHF